MPARRGLLLSTRSISPQLGGPRNLSTAAVYRTIVRRRRIWCRWSPDPGTLWPSGAYCLRRIVKTVVVKMSETVKAQETVADIDLIKKVVELAGRAPSLHNSQPWQWVIRGTELQLWLDRSRIVRNTDRGGREALISCGAALDHLRVAAAAAGWQTFVERFPNPNRPEHLA